jgi:hypothetical protein
MNKLIYITSFALLILFLSCKTTEKMGKDDVVIELEKTYCSGKCPVYKLKIASNGVVKLEGIENIENIGNFKSRLSKEQLEALIQDFESINFFSLSDSYRSFMLDLPTSYISYTVNGKTKKIKAYDNVPKQLLNLIDKIDKLVYELDWKELK